MTEAGRETEESENLKALWRTRHYRHALTFSIPVESKLTTRAQPYIRTKYSPETRIYSTLLFDELKSAVHLQLIILFLLCSSWFSCFFLNTFFGLRVFLSRSQNMHSIAHFILLASLLGLVNVGAIPVKVSDRLYTSQSGRSDIFQPANPKAAASRSHVLAPVSQS
jgi:hypothetical protein